IAISCLLRCRLGTASRFRAANAGGSPVLLLPQSPQGSGGRPFAALKEGGGAPEGATLVQPLRAARLKRQARRLSALHRGDFGPRDRASGVGRQTLRPPYRAAFAALVLPSSSPSVGGPT